MTECTLRPADLTAEGDLHYILSSWLKTYREEGRFTRRIRPAVFYQEHERAIKRLFAEDDTEVLIACTEKEPEVILGYAVNRENALHWIFVRPEFRGMGIAKLLLEDFPLDHASFSHWTICCDELINKLLEQYPSMTYNPYLF